MLGFRVRVIVCVSFAFLYSWETYAQYLAPGYTMKQWTIEDGLPVNSVNEIILAENGYLWMATNGGLVRFDGNDFKIYTSFEYPGLTGNRILNLAESGDGSILIQNQGARIFALKDERFTLLTSSDQGLVGESLHIPFYKDSEGAIWFGTDEGAGFYKDGSLELFEPTIINKSVEKVFKAENGIIWFRYADDSYMYRYEQKQVKKIIDTSPRSLGLDPVKIDFLFAAFATHGTTEWIATRLAIYTYQNDTLTKVYETDDFFLDELDIDANGTLRVSAIPSYDKKTTERLMFEFKDGNLVPGDIPVIYSELNYFASIDNQHFWLVGRNEVYKDQQLIFSTGDIIGGFIIDPEGSFWIPTVYGGLIQIKENLFSTLSTNDGLPGNNAYSVFQDQDSSIWIGTFGKGIAKFSRQGISTDFDIKGSGNDGFILTIEQLQDGTLLLGGLGSGVLFLNENGNTFTSYTIPDSIKGRSIHSIFEDSHKRLWLGTSPIQQRGLFMREGEQWELVAGRKEGAPVATYQYIMETTKGDVWMAARGKGLVRFDGSKYYNYSTKDGLTSDFIRALYSYSGFHNSNILALQYL